MHSTKLCRFGLLTSHLHKLLPIPEQIALLFFTFVYLSKCKTVELGDQQSIQQSNLRG